jgi:hypothetical protein
MTRRVTSPPGQEYYAVRVVLPNALLHLASRKEPNVVFDGNPNRPVQILHVEADWLTEPDKGDTIGHIDWSCVTAITWRWTGEAGSVQARPRHPHRPGVDWREEPY